MDTLAPLSENDILPYFKIGVVRIFKNNKWFVGELSERTLFDPKNEKHKLRVEPLISFTPLKLGLDPMNPGKTLISGEDRPIPSTFTPSALPFTLLNPMKIIPRSTTHGLPELLIIQFDGGAAIISIRPDDIKAVRNLINY